MKRKFINNWTNERIERNQKMIQEMYQDLDDETEMIDRLEYLDSGKDTSYEVWIDPETGKTYSIDITIKRDFSNIHDREIKS
jgi:uncharacterized protein (DUF2147 family)